MFKHKLAIAFVIYATLIVVAESGPAAYGVCQAGCAAAAGIATRMSGGLCSILVVWRLTPLVSRHVPLPHLPPRRKKYLTE